MPFKLSKRNKEAVISAISIVETLNDNCALTGPYHFKRICERTQVFACKELGIVFKKPNFILNPNTPKKVRIPTISIVHENIGDGWVVQPIAKKVNTKLAVQIIREQLNGVFCDLHRWNVGWWNGKPYLFDW